MSNIKPRGNSFALGMFVHSDVDDSDLTVYEFRVYSHLCRRVGDERRVWEGQKRIAACCKMSRPAVQKALYGLRDKGWLELRERFREEDNSQTTNDIILLGPPASEKGTPRTPERQGPPLRKAPEVDPLEVDPGEGREGDFNNSAEPKPPATPEDQKIDLASDIDLPSQEENDLAPVAPETYPANSAQSTVPGRGAAAGGEDAIVLFHGLLGYGFVSRYQKDLPRWAEQYTPAFIRLARDLANTLPGAKGQFTIADLLNQDSRKPWPVELVQQYKADLKAKHTAPADRVPVLGEILVCGPNSGKVLEVLHADRLVSIQTGPGLADYLTVPWASTQPAVRRSA
ncbi:hypothetical protein GCM10022631_12030 [Deinococcus rubellus]|uniref:Helix-turn-helix domain-containing protein n=1 Tax=Deinococcus rubellus TaxID=1889240 RepID=A0ABY5YF04_9DEIO|nr:helix-turn-helix domain-containing protein [Deinococcus rubellus]UWX62751.1 hypothetical protein N0D28_08190 [Deinococcus rubellus]